MEKHRMKAPDEKLKVWRGFRENRQEKEERKGKRTEEREGEREQRTASAARRGGR